MLVRRWELRGSRKGAEGAKNCEELQKDRKENRWIAIEFSIFGVVPWRSLRLRGEMQFGMGGTGTDPAMSARRMRRRENTTDVRSAKVLARKRRNCFGYREGAEDAKNCMGDGG